jgi:transitional endoplasmic reticulum ATPase
LNQNGIDQSSDSQNASTLLQQFASCKDKASLLSHYAGLQPSELLSARPFTPTLSSVRLAGIDPLIRNLQFLILKPLLSPEIFSRIGVNPPRGILLTGPSGSGKTSLARFMAETARVSLFHVAGVDIIAKEVGESEKRLHSVFERARASSPSLMLFDDIDSIAPRRNFGETLSQTGDRLLTTLLVEMDGILGGRDDGIVIVGTTNRLDALDPAILRPGRFDFVVNIGLPDAEGRGAIFDLYTRDMPLENRDRCREMVVNAAAMLSGAEIEGIVREAAVIALRKDLGVDVVSVDAFDAAIRSCGKSIGEAKKKRVWLDLKQRKRL